MGQKFIFTFATREVNIVSRPIYEGRSYCTECRCEVSWLSPEEVMVLQRKGLREIFRLVEAGKYHVVENTAGFLLICAGSAAAPD